MEGQEKAMEMQEETTDVSEEIAFILFLLFFLPLSRKNHQIFHNFI